ncbi:MAG: DNRLRE domain-containing protein, partial [bacterium]
MNRLELWRAVLGLMAITVISALAPAKAAVVTNTPTSDGQVATNTWTKDFTSTSFQIGQGVAPGDTRAFLKFDLSNIPVGATITSATVRLYESATNFYGYGGSTLYRISATWDTNTAGITIYTNNATSLGGLNPDAINSWATRDITATVSSWYTGSVSNYGLEVRGMEGFTLTSRSFNSSENAANKPQLVVGYSAGSASISNTAPTNVISTSACLNGYLASTGAFDTAVFVYYGPTDGGANAANWANTNIWPSPQTSGPFSPNVSLPSGSDIFYRYAASNAAGVVWAPSSGYLVTTNVSISVNPAAIGENSATGTFTFARPATTTGGALTVYFTIGGTASNGVDYSSLTATNITLAAGVSSTTLLVRTLADGIVEGNETVDLTEQPGAYVLNVPATTTLIIGDTPTVSNLPPAGVTATSASLNGFLSGATDTAVYVYYGPTDGGTNPASWAATDASQSAPQGVGAKSATVTLPSGGET